MCQVQCGAAGIKDVCAEAGGDFETTHLAGGCYLRRCGYILTGGTLFQVSAVAYDQAVCEGKSRLSGHSMIAATMKST
jgi:hypothetical protein